MKAKSLLHGLLTYPGDKGLEFLLWREDQHWVWRYLLLMPAVGAHSLMRIADMLDDVFDHYKRD